MWGVVVFYFILEMGEIGKRGVGVLMVFGGAKMKKQMFF